MDYNYGIQNLNRNIFRQNDIRQQQNFGNGNYRNYLGNDFMNINNNFHMNNPKLNLIQNENFIPQIRRNKTHEKFQTNNYIQEKQTQIRPTENYMKQRFNMNINDNRNQNNPNFYHNKDKFDIRPKNDFSNNNINNNKFNNNLNNKFNNNLNNKFNNNINNQIKIETQLETPNPTTSPVSEINKKLLKALIYIYYFEKSLADKNEKNLFYNSDTDFYLINPDFLKQFKDFYSYNEIKKWLDLNAKSYNYGDIKYLSSLIEHYIDQLLKKNLLKKEFLWDGLKNIKGINTIVTKIGGIIFTNEGMILPSNIIDIIKSFDEKVKNAVNPKNFIFSSNLVYYINNPNKIIIGNLQRSNAMFTPEYIFEYNNNIEKSEKDKLFHIPINEYIIQRKCNPYNNKNQVQNLINEQGQPIGSLIILNKQISSSPAKKNNMNMVQKNNEAQNNVGVRNNMEINRNIEMENQKKKQEELINNNINLNNQISNLLRKKDIQNQNIKNELNKLKQENAFMIKNNKENEILSIQSIESIMYPMKMNEIELLNFKQKENQYIQINKDLQEKQRLLNQLNETYNKLSKNVADLNQMKDNLVGEINQKKGEISNINDIINLKNNYNNEINKLKLELKQKNDQLSNIENDFENKRKQLIQQYNEKEMELNNIKSELQRMKMNEINLNLIKNKENEINKRSQELNDKEKNLNNLIEKYKELGNINKNLESNISDLSKKRQNLIDEIKQYEEMKTNKRESIVNTNNILNNKLKELEKELQQKNKQLSDNNLIKQELDKVIKEKNELNKQIFDKDDELKMLKSEMNQMKINEGILNNLNKKNQELTEANKKLNNEMYDLMNKYKKLLEEKKQNEEVESNKKNELINKNNNLIKQLNDMQKILEQKDKQILNINLIKKDLEKLSKENKELSQQKNEKEKEINLMRLKINQMEKNELNSISLQNKEIEINKKLKELNEKENNLIFLNKRNKELATENKNLENQISNLNKNKQKLNDELKKLELQILNKKEALEKLNFNQNQNQINKNANKFPRPKSSNQLSNQININSPQKVNMISSPNQINNNPMMNNIVQNNNNNNNQGFPPNPNPNVINIPPPPPVPKKPGPIPTYTKPTLIGLNNIGSTCYKNAVLECLSQTKDLTNYFLKEDNYNKIINNNIAKKNPGTKTLCHIYYNLIKNLWKKNATFKSFSPDEFMNSISEMTKNDQVQFSLYEAGDAKDFIIYILERMHNELKQPVKNKFWKLGPNDKLNQYDKNNAFLFFLDEFQNDTSIVSDLFYGFNETTNVCQFCKNKYNSNGQIEPICYNYGIFNILIFPLEEVRKYREQMMRMTNTNINIGAMANVVSLFECFFYNQKSDYFTGDNKNYCNICRQLFDSVYTSKIFVSPNILIMILNRGKGNIFNIKLDFSLQIDITDFVLTKSQNREIYNLYGVITHLGQSGPNAHFVAACKSPVDGNWYRYNDAIVTQINNFQNDIYNFGTPYILFYEKQKQK